MLLTLGSDPSEGIILNHNGDVNVGGHIFSNSILVARQLHQSQGPSRKGLGLGYV